VEQLAPYGCGEAARVFTVNGIVRPKIDIASGEKQFWRIVNASPDLYADLEVDSESMTVLAFDGMPLTYHDHNRHTEKRRHVLPAPAGRAEVIVEGPKRGGTASLRSLCVNTGADVPGTFLALRFRADPGATLEPHGRSYEPL
jgi:suppressor of ftsI